MWYFRTNTKIKFIMIATLLKTKTGTTNEADLENKNKIN